VICWVRGVIVKDWFLLTVIFFGGPFEIDLIIFWGWELLHVQSHLAGSSINLIGKLLLLLNLVNYLIQLACLVIEVPVEHLVPLLGLSSRWLLLLLGKLKAVSLEKYVILGCSWGWKDPCEVARPSCYVT